MRLLGTQKKKQANGQKQIKMGQAKGESWRHRFGQGAIMPCLKWDKSEHKSPTAVRQGSCALLQKTIKEEKREKKRP